jgi:RHS repeat-associated protein
MTARRTPTVLLGLLVLLATFLWPAPAAAFHFPWDQGHDTFNPDHGDDTDPGDDGPNECGSPVEVASGNFVFSFQILSLLSYGPSTDLTLTYNSKDLRNGPFGKGWVHTYDQRVVKTTDQIDVYAICGQANGKRERFVRDSSGSFVAPPHVRTSLGEKSDGGFELREKNGTIRRFGSDSRLLEIEDRNGNHATFDYDGSGFLVSITDASGRQVTLTKGADGRIAAVTDPMGRSYLFAYDAKGNLVAVTDPAAESTTLRYDAANRLIEVIDPLGHSQVALSYDTSDRVRTHRHAAQTWTYTYNTAQRRTTKVDNSGRSFTYEYAESGNITRVIDPLGNSERFVYDSSFNVVERTNPRGQITRVTYDGSGNPLTVTDASGATRSMTYEPSSDRITSMTSADGRTTRFEYDARGNLTRSVNADGLATIYQYDALGQLVKVTDRQGAESHLVYDTHGHLIETLDPEGNRSSATYDLLGKILTVTDPLGRTTESTYDDKDRKVSERAADGGLIQYAYDAVDNLISLTTPNGATTRYEYDTFNRLVRTINPLGGVSTFAYDTRDNLVGATDPKGQTATFTYDALDRLRTKVKPDDTITYSYDAAGNVIAITDGDSSLTYVYDPLNRILETRTAATAGQPASLIRYTYDAEGRRRTMTDPAGGVQHYTYDSGSRLARLVDPAGNVFDFAYDDLDRRTGLTLGASGSVDWTYDPASRVTAISHGSSTLGYAYDMATNRVSMSDRDGIHSYAFDALNRLTGASHPAGQPSESYVYDLMGNRISSHVSAVSTYDLANRLLADDRFDYSYDANGNRIAKVERASGATTSYTYDSENRLVRVDLPGGGLATYRYDGLGRRIAKEVDGQVTQYVYDEHDILFEYAGTVVAARYTHGPAIDEILAVVRAGVSFFFETDALGSVRRVVDDAGVEVASYTYDSFGNLVQESGTPQGPYFFQGRELDRESGLYFFRARYYDPETGQYLSEDPLGFSAGTNFYTFVDNNPVGLTDPFGLEVGFWESLIPVWGSGKQAYEDFACGRWGWGAFNTVMAISDVFLVKALVTGVGKAVFKTGLRQGMSRPNPAFPRGVEWVEQSHWIPRRHLPESLQNAGWNLKPMWGSDHALADPFRYRFMPKWWKAQNPMPHPAVQQVQRIPNGVQGAGAGAASAGGRAANSSRDSDCNCQ